MSIPKVNRPSRNDSVEQVAEDLRNEHVPDVLRQPASFDSSERRSNLDAVLGTGQDLGLDIQGPKPSRGRVESVQQLADRLLNESMCDDGVDVESLASAIYDEFRKGRRSRARPNNLLRAVFDAGDPCVPESQRADLAAAIQKEFRTHGLAYLLDPLSKAVLGDAQLGVPNS